MFNEILKDTMVQSRLEWDNIERDNIKNEVEQIVRRHSSPFLMPFASFRK